MAKDPTAAGAGIAVASVGSVQFGAALAATLFPVAGPIGTVSLRLVGAALAMLALTRPWRLRWSARDLRAALVFGFVLVVMNAAIYTAISRLPLATAITLEFFGPLAVSVATARSWRHRAWTLPAAAGVALLGGSLRVDDATGVIAALTAAIGWAAYIMLSRALGRSAEGAPSGGGGPSAEGARSHEGAPSGEGAQGAGLAGLCLASVFGALVMAPVGLALEGPVLLSPSVLLLGLAVGVVSSAIPYSLDLLALRRLPTAVFGVLTSLNPAVAALAGLLILGERLPGRQLAGIGLVVVASAGIALSARSMKPVALEPLPRDHAQTHDLPVGS